MTFDWILLGEFLLIAKPTLSPPGNIYLSGELGDDYWILLSLALD